MCAECHGSICIICNVCEKYKGKYNFLQIEILEILVNDNVCVCVCGVIFAFSVS